MSKGVNEIKKLVYKMNSNLLVALTFIELFYLIYMFFYFETDVYIGPSVLESTVHNIHSIFVHHTGRKESKICDMGRMLAVVAISLFVYRLFYPIRWWNIAFDLFAIFLAVLLNLNAVVYLIPILGIEWYINNV